MMKRWETDQLSLTPAYFFSLISLLTACCLGFSPTGVRSFSNISQAFPSFRTFAHCLGVFHAFFFSRAMTTPSDLASSFTFSGKMSLTLKLNLVYFASPLSPYTFHLCLALADIYEYGHSATILSLLEEILSYNEGLASTEWKDKN